MTVILQKAHAVTHCAQSSITFAVVNFRQEAEALNLAAEDTRGIDLAALCPKRVAFVLLPVHAVLLHGEDLVNPRQPDQGRLVVDVPFDGAGDAPLRACRIPPPPADDVHLKG